MKIVENPTIELEEKDIETIKKICDLIKHMPCSSLLCGQCPFNTICDYVDVAKPESMVLNIQKALNKALIK